MEEKTKKIPFKESMAGPTVILLLICLVVACALSVVYQMTAPIIEKINMEKAAEARQTVLPDADSFKPYKGKLPKNVEEYYLAATQIGRASCRERV